MPTNMNETSLETLIVNYLVNQNGYELSTSADYDTTYVLDIRIASWAILFYLIAI